MSTLFVSDWMSTVFVSDLMSTLFVSDWMSTVFVSDLMSTLFVSDWMSTVFADRATARRGFRMMYNKMHEYLPLELPVNDAKRIPDLSFFPPPPPPDQPHVPILQVRQCDASSD
ncbi:hypothetical protein EVAR_5571_1 [Eumeta japonica]|uniref:Uncharacterized protein n=1 Tax=Eumeta variegata TaxID=151549 RepID=A0A4C1U1C2_EUMVA|nr:hypothetical protein EVAR_5571_1 [Eumeta japonica]